LLKIIDDNETQFSYGDLPNIYTSIRSVSVSAKLCLDVLRLRSYIVLARKAIALESKLMNRKNVSHTPQIVRKGTRNYLFDRTNIVFRDEGPKTSRLGNLENFRDTHLKITT
jgi:hypothetical protein